ncbi:MAG: hypothetical protein K5770_11320 [Lachnospiraceae bacterium]|nr:hypothetical protein [Lachnospiraceae bacterium]
MKIKNFRPDGLKLAAFAYLYIPVIIFFMTWLKWYLALPACAAVAYSLAMLFSREDHEEDKRGVLFWALAALVFVLCLFWCCLSGIGGFVLQSGDFPKHNIILKDLINCGWPVRYRMRGREGVLSYYIGGYIVPALFGKIAGGSFDMAQDALLVWTALGIFISVLIIFRCIEKRMEAFDSEKGMSDISAAKIPFNREGSKKTEISLIAVFFVLFTFATFVCPLSGIFAKWYPWEAGDGVHWLSNTIFIQYSSNITLLSYVFPQAVPALLSVSLLRSMRREYDKWGLILAPLALYSAFVFLGMAILMATIFAADAITGRGECLKSGNILSVYNICSAFTALCLVLNLLGVILQEKPESIAMSLELIDYTGYVHTLVFFEVSWLLWVLILSRHKSVLILAASINLFFYPFLKMGYYNDLCMRASIPALLILCVEAAERLVISFNRDRWYSLLIAACLVITAAGPFQELSYCYNGRNTESRNYYELYESSEDFFFSYDFLEYQYIDWNPEGISRFVYR